MESPKRDTLCKLRGIALEGGGVTGIAHIGVIKVLDELGILPRLTHFAGSSAGSLLVILLACRVPYEQIREINFNLDYSKFEDNSWFMFRDMYRLINQFGWNPGNTLSTIVEDILQKYVGNKNITFGEVKIKYGATLIITATDIGTEETIYYTPDTHPTMPVVDAARQSTSIPLFYCPVTKDGHMYIDGGLLNNYPIRKLYEYLPPERVFGVKLMSPQQLTRRHENIIPKNILEYTRVIIQMLHEQASRSHIKKEDWKRTIKVNTGDISSTNFKLTVNQKYWLMDQGEIATKDFFDSS